MQSDDLIQTEYVVIESIMHWLVTVASSGESLPLLHKTALASSPIRPPLLMDYHWRADVRIEILLKNPYCT